MLTVVSRSLSPVFTLGSITSDPQKFTWDCRSIEDGSTLQMFEVNTQQQSGWLVKKPSNDRITNKVMNVGRRYEEVYLTGSRGEDVPALFIPMNAHKRDSFADKLTEAVNRSIRAARHEGTVRTHPKQPALATA